MTNRRRKRETATEIQTGIETEVCYTSVLRWRKKSPAKKSSQLLEGKKGRKCFFPKSLLRNQPCTHLDFSSVRLNLYF